MDAIRASQSDLENRVSALEAWQQSVNADILHLKTVVGSLEGNDYITAVTPLADGSGYSITFAKSGAVKKAVLKRKYYFTGSTVML